MRHAAAVAACYRWPTRPGEANGRSPMPVYLIANVKVTDDKWIPDYAAVVHGIAARHGGRDLPRSRSSRTLEGEAPDLALLALSEFPSVEAVEAVANEPDDAPHGKARQAGSVS